MKKIVGFLLYHLFFGAAILAVSIMGVTLVNYVFTALAVVIAIIGILSFFVGLEFIFGIYDSMGNEYYATNIKHKLIVSFSILIIAFAVYSIPEMMDVPEFLVAVFIALLAWMVGFKTGSENGRGNYDISDFTHLLGKAVPVSYILCVGVLILSLAFNLSPVILIVCSSIAALIHLVRIVAVLKDRPF